MVRLTAGVLVAIALAGLRCAGTVQAESAQTWTHAASLKSLVLNKADAPSGFTTVRSQFISNAQDARNTHTPVAVLAKHGRINGYETEFEASRNHGMLVLDNAVSAFKSSAGPVWALAQADARARKTFRGEHYTVLKAPRMGSRAVAYSYRGKSGRTTFDTILLGFSRGPYEADVIIAGTPGSVSLALATRYARVIDGRIRQRG